MQKKKTTWKIIEPKDDIDLFDNKFNLDPVILGIIRNRGIKENQDLDQYINSSIKYLHHPNLFLDIDKATDIIIDSIQKKEKIRIVGDYDTDGTCATYILYSAIHDIYNLVDFYIPDRILDGYGINNAIIKNAFDDGISTIITCDNGISAIDEVDYAKELGIKIIITDHHRLKYIEDDLNNKTYIYPNADAVVNPWQSSCGYPFKEICGAFVAFKLVAYLFRKLEHKNEDLLMQLLFFAGIATVGDIMPLVDENRCVVRYFLNNLQKCNNIGLCSLVDRLKIDKSNVKAYDIAFRISPCINASGRLDTAMKVLDLFMCKDRTHAYKISDELISLNSKRQSMTTEQLNIAEKIISDIDDSKKVIVIYLPNCHESIAGIVAGKIKEAYNRPTLVLTDADNKILKGSGRSIEEYNMYDEITKCKDLLIRFGGHKLAAGFSLLKENLSAFEQRLNDNSTLTDSDLEYKLMIDREVLLDYLSFKFIDELEVLEPLGNGNEKPVFVANNLRIVSIKEIGKDNQYLKLKLGTYNKNIDALCFQNSSQLKDALISKYGIDTYNNLIIENTLKDVRISVVYYPQINEYNGYKNIQIIINDFEL